ncbi:MAG: inositol monophosphatase [Gammaproteobacteria bacterium]|nr:MAG: inositol monophosphatase [Gammaproteobacteria bacterium]
MTAPDIDSLADLVRTTARETLLPRFCSVRCEWKADGSAITEADLACDQALRDALATRWPGIGLLSEEMPEAERAALLDQPGNRFWVIDPLDGTNNYANGIPFFCTSVALVEGDRIVLGVVYDPVRDECFAAAAGAGARLNGGPLQPARETPSLNKALLLCNPDRLAPELRRRLLDPEPPYGSLRNFGALALEWCWTALGRGHVYFHARQNLWDYAAGWLVLNESGGRATQFDGQPLPARAANPCTALASRSPALHEALRRHLGLPGRQPQADR